MTEYLTAVEAGKMLGVSPSRVRQFVLEGRLPAKKVGSAILIIAAKDVAALRRKRQKKTNGNGHK